MHDSQGIWMTADYISLRKHGLCDELDRLQSLRDLRDDPGVLERRRGWMIDAGLRLPVFYKVVRIFLTRSGLFA
jgi:hypothetical protein